MRDGGLGGRGRGGRSQERNPKVRLQCVQSKVEKEHHESHWSAGSQVVKETPKPSAVQSRGCCVWQGRGQLSTGARPRGYMYTHQCSDGRLRPAAHPCVNCTAILHLEHDGRKETGARLLKGPLEGVPRMVATLLEARTCLSVSVQTPRGCPAGYCCTRAKSRVRLFQGAQ